MADIAKEFAQPAAFAMRKPVIGLMAIGVLIIFMASFKGGLGIPNEWRPAGVGQIQEDPLAKVPAFMDKLKKNPDDIRALQEIAEAFSRERDWEKAAHFWGRVVELMPDDIRALYHRGTALMYISSFDEAIADYEKILTLDPGAYYALFYLGLLHKHGLRENDRAREYFQRALELEPQSQSLVNAIQKEMAGL